MKKKQSKTFSNTFLVAIIIILSGYIILDIANSYYLENFKNANKENIEMSKSSHAFGIDISHYNGILNWEEITTSKHPIKFVIFRATMGKDGADKHFKTNWVNAKKHHFLRGAYHYYRPSESSVLQFENFAKTVSLQSGDIIPVLDIEEQSPYGAQNLRIGVLNWLSLAEKKYGVKPIIYTGLSYYNDFLKGHVNDYPLWIASYSKNESINTVNWKFHQFTEKMVINGIETNVDGNYFKGSLEDLLKFCK